MKNTLALFCLCLPLTVGAMEREKLGTLQVTDITLRPSFVIAEPSTAGFFIGESSAGFSWNLEQRFSAKFRVGPASLMNKPARYSLVQTEELAIVEGYGEWLGAYGRLRMGLLPLEFGAEGSLPEAELRFPRSQLFSRRVMGLRDMGLSYFIENKGYFTEFVVHNGEGESNTDGRVWLTSKWGWMDAGKTQVGLSGQTGTTKPDSTSTSGDTLANVDETKPALWRLGGLFMDWKASAFKFQLEAYMGEREQQKNIVKFSAGHMDLIYDFSPGFGLQLRYDSFDPNHKADGDLVKEITGGIRLSHNSQTSNFYLYLTKVLEESGQFPNDRASLTWVLTP